MKKIILCFLLFTQTSMADEPSSVSCIENNIPEGKMTKYMVYRQNQGASILSLKKNERGELASQILITDLECVNANADPKILNCIHPTPEGSKNLADATFTIIKHTYTAAGSIKNRSTKDIITESYRFYFRDDRNGNKEISKNFFLNQCRISDAGELNWAANQLKKN